MLFRLEEIIESECAVDGIEGESDALVVGREDAIESPSEVGTHGEVFERLELTAYLQAPCEATQVFREIVVGTGHLGART